MDKEIYLVMHGETIPVTNLFDIDGESVNTWEEAHTFCAGPTAGGKWISGKTEDFQKHTAQ